MTFYVRKLVTSDSQEGEPELIYKGDSYEEAQLEAAKANANGIKVTLSSL